MVRVEMGRISRYRISMGLDGYGKIGQRIGHMGLSYWARICETTPSIYQVMVF